MSRARPTRLGAQRLIGGGTAGNERLAAVTGALLIGLLAIIGVTLIALTPLLSVHMFVGMLLLGPVTLKLASTGYRFIPYYTADESYGRKGPPPIALRLIAPAVVVSTVIVFASGVALLFAGPSSRHSLVPIHKVSFIVWGAFTALHVLAHLRAVPSALRAELTSAAPGATDTTGRLGRIISLAGALTAGATVAILTIPEFGPWPHTHNLDHR